MNGVDDFPSMRGIINIPPDGEGQYPSPAFLPRAMTMVWEDEATLCIAVDINGVHVTRRCDNNMINGTKLLNGLGVSRGKRDGILKQQTVKHVVKIGTINLKGVWIPFEKALDLAKHENRVDSLYPLFVADIERLVYDPQNLNTTLSQLSSAASRNPALKDWTQGIPYRRY